MITENSEYDVEKFRQYIIGLKKDSTMGDFAKKCGISREHLSRLLNGNAKKRPSIETLKKIADATGSDCETLLILCGYAGSPSDARKKMEFKDRVHLNAEDMMDGLQALAQDAKFYNSLKDYLDTYKILYSHESCQYRIRETKEYDGSLFNGAENCATVEVSFKGFEGTCWTFAVLYYSVTKGGRYLIQGTAMDGASLLEVEFMKADIMKQLGISRTAIQDMPYVTYIKESPEERLYKSIFGNMESEEYLFPETGIGIDVTVMPPNTAEFIMKHESSLSEEDRTFFNTKNFTEKDDVEKYFEDMEDDESCAKGYKCVLAAIMRAETQLPFTAFESNAKGSREIDGRIPAGIFCPDTDNSNEDVMKSSKEYAKELGLTEYGEQLVFMIRFRSDTYKVEE